MRLATLVAIIGLILAALGGLWYWQIMRVAIAFAGSTGGSDLNRTAWLALGLVGLGVAIFLTCVVISFVAKDRDT